MTTEKEEREVTHVPAEIGTCSVCGVECPANLFVESKVVCPEHWEEACTRAQRSYLARKNLSMFLKKAIVVVLVMWLILSITPA